MTRVLTVSISDELYDEIFKGDETKKSEKIQTILWNGLGKDLTPLQYLKRAIAIMEGTEQTHTTPIKEVKKEKPIQKEQKIEQNNIKSFWDNKELEPYIDEFQEYREPSKEEGKEILTLLKEIKQAQENNEEMKEIETENLLKKAIRTCKSKVLKETDVEQLSNNYKNACIVEERH